METDDLGSSGPAMDLLQDDDEDSEAENVPVMMNFGSSEFGEESDEEDEEELEVERQARALDEQAVADKEAGEEELKTNIEAREKFVLPSGQQLEQDSIVTEDVSLVQTRMAECVRVLNNFKELREEGR